MITRPESSVRNPAGDHSTRRAILGWSAGGWNCGLDRAQHAHARRRHSPETSSDVAVVGPDLARNGALHLGAVADDPPSPHPDDRVAVAVGRVGRLLDRLGGTADLQATHLPRAE